MTSRRTDDALASLVGELPANGETITLSVTTSADNTAVLAKGVIYDMVASEDCFVCASATAGADDAAVTDYFLPGKTIVSFTPQTGNLYVSAITASGTATLYISPRTAVV